MSHLIPLFGDCNMGTARHTLCIASCTRVCVVLLADHARRYIDGVNTTKSLKRIPYWSDVFSLLWCSPRLFSKTIDYIGAVLGRGFTNRVKVSTSEGLGAGDPT